MSNVDTRLRAVGLALVAALTLAACKPVESYSPGGGDQQPPTPPAAATVPAGYDVYFNVEVLGPRGSNGTRRPYTRQVIIYVEVLTTTGQYATYTNPNTGQRATGPYTDVRTTPVHHGVTFVGGIASATFTATYAGYTDEQMSCWVERDGHELPGSRDTETIGPTVNGRGGARALCHYVPAG